MFFLKERENCSFEAGNLFVLSSLSVNPIRTSLLLTINVIKIDRKKIDWLYIYI